MQTLRRSALAVLVLAALPLLAGCENPFSPRVGSQRAIATPPPKPTTPRKLMELIQWCWVNRAVGEYEELFTEDFRFAFAAADSADNPPILRDEEISIARRLFQEGHASAPRANRIEYTYQNPIVPLPDSRPGKMSPWHQEVQTRVVLHLTFDDATMIDVESDVNFFLVRGDSADIPPDLEARGFGPDPNRWYIERWEERGSGALAMAGPPAQALASGAGAATLDGARRETLARGLGAQANRATWGRLKARYRNSPF